MWDWAGSYPPASAAFSHTNCCCSTVPGPADAPVSTYLALLKVVLRTVCEAMPGSLKLHRCFEGCVTSCDIPVLPLPKWGFLTKGRRKEEEEKKKKKDHRFFTKDIRSHHKNDSEWTRQNTGISSLPFRDSYEANSY